MKKTLLSLTLAAAAFAGAANATPVYPIAVVSADQNGTNVAADRSDPTVLFDAYTDGDQFYSLGLGGNLVLDFGSNLYGIGKIIEVTFKLAHYIETADVYISNSTTFSGGPIASVLNADAQDGFSFLVSTPFRYIKLVDTSPITNDKSRDGFDVAEVSFSPVPVPAAGLMLAGAVAGLGALRRRAKKA
jgi:hypothetical protein